MNVNEQNNVNITSSFSTGIPRLRENYGSRPICIDYIILYAFGRTF